MIQVETSVSVERPPEVVFAFLWGRYARPTWAWGVTSTEDAGPRPAERLAEVAVCEPNCRLGVRHRIGDAACDAVYHLEAIESGTRVIWTGRITVNGRYRFFETLIGQAAMTEAEIGLAVLKQLPG